MSLSLAAAGLIGAGISAGGGLIGNLINRQTARENLSYQEAANNQNIAFQKAENDITRAREDTAVQRAAADMQAAGLSKTLSAGQPANAAALTAPKTQALNNSFRYESALEKLNLGSLFLDMAAKQQQLEINQRQSDVDIAYKLSQTAHQNLVNDHFEEQFSLDKEFTFAQTAYQKAQTARVDSENELLRIENKYAAQKAIAEINSLSAQRAATNAQALLTTKNIEKAAYEIQQIVIKNENLSKEGEKLVLDIAYASLQNEALIHNIKVAGRYDYPVGVFPSGIVNYLDRTGKDSSYEFLGSDLGFKFGVPSLYQTLLDPENKYISNPRKAEKFFNIFRNFFNR